MSIHFPLISGNPAIDLVNTEVVRRGIRCDLLETELDLKNWVEVMHLSESLVGHDFGDESWRDTLHSVWKIRTLLRSGFEKIADKQVLKDTWQCQLEQIIQSAPFSFRIVHGKLTPIPIGPLSKALPSLITLSALQLLASKVLFKLHRCANPDCVLLFLDESGRRKWCSMKLCGNRAKVARHQSLQSLRR